MRGCLDTDKSFKRNVDLKYSNLNDNGGMLHSTCMEIIGVDLIAPKIMRSCNDNKITTKKAHQY